MQSASVAAAPREMELYPTCATTNSVVTVSGADMMTSARMYCRCVRLIDHHQPLESRLVSFSVTDVIERSLLLPQNGHRIGRHLVSAEYNTSLVGVHSLVRCQVPQQASGFYSLEITHNGRDFTSSGLIFEHLEATINDAFPRQLNPSGGTLVTVQGAGFRDGLLCRTGVQEVAVMAAVSSSAILVCETLAVQEQNLHDSIYLSIIASRQQSSLSDMYNLVIDGARVKGARSVIHLRNARTDEIVIDGQGFNINLRNAWCKVGTLVVRGTVLSSSRLSCKLPFIARKCPTLLVSFNQADFTAVEDIEWDSTRCISHEHFHQLPERTQENVLDQLEEHTDVMNSKGTLHVDDRNTQPSVYLSLIHI